MRPIDLKALTKELRDYAIVDQPEVVSRQTARFKHPAESWQKATLQLASLVSTEHSDFGNILRFKGLRSA